MTPRSNQYNGLYSRVIAATTAKDNLATYINVTDELTNGWQFVVENMTSELTIPPEQVLFGY